MGSEGITISTSSISGLFSGLGVVIIGPVSLVVDNQEVGYYLSGKTWVAMILCIKKTLF